MANLQVCTTVINHVSLSVYRRGGEGKKERIERGEEKREGRRGREEREREGRRGRERGGEGNIKRRDYYERWEMPIVHGSVQHSWKLSDMRKVATSAT